MCKSQITSFKISNGEITPGYYASLFLKALSWPKSSHNISCIFFYSLSLKYINTHCSVTPRGNELHTLAIEEILQNPLLFLLMAALH